MKFTNDRVNEVINYGSYNHLPENTATFPPEEIIAVRFDMAGADILNELSLAEAKSDLYHLLNDDIGTTEAIIREVARLSAYRTKQPHAPKIDWNDNTPLAHAIHGGTHAMDSYESFLLEKLSRPLCNTDEKKKLLVSVIDRVIAGVIAETKRHDKKIAPLKDAEDKALAVYIKAKEARQTAELAKQKMLCDVSGAVYAKIYDAETIPQIERDERLTSYSGTCHAGDPVGELEFIRNSLTE